MSTIPRKLFPLVVLAVVSFTGCLRDDERLVQLARESADRQASQNLEMAQLNQRVADSHNRVLDLQHSLESQQTEIHTQRDALESERRQIAQQRLRESLLAPLLAGLGPLTVCALVLVFCVALIYGLRSDTSADEVISEILIEELTSSEPRLLLPHAEALTVNEPPPQLPHEAHSETTDPVRR